MNEEFRSVLEDRVTVTDYWLGVTLVYTGQYDLVSITPKERFTEFVLLIPKFDFEELTSEYFSGKLQIADAKAFGRTATDIGRLIKDAKRDGQPYINPDFEEMLRDEAAAGRGQEAKGREYDSYRRNKRCGS